MLEPVKPSAVGRRPMTALLPSGDVVDFALTVSTIAVGAGAIYSIASLTERGWVDKDRLTMSLSIACPLVTMVQYVSPGPVVLDALRKNNASNLPTPVFQSQAACNILGIAYGIQITNAAVLVTNMFGLACQILFLASEHYVRSPSAGWLYFSFKLLAMFDSFLYVFATIAPINILGHTITLFNIILFAVPLTKLGVILKTKNASSLPTAMTFISVANNFTWSLYALMIQDVVVLLPSVLGFMLSLFQVLVILWCQGVLPFGLGFLLLPCRESGDVLPSVTPRKSPDGSEDEKG